MSYKALLYNSGARRLGFLDYHTYKAALYIVAYLINIPFKNIKQSPTS